MEDETRKWMGHLDPTGLLTAEDEDEPPTRIERALPFARLAVVQTIGLALILAAAVVAIMSIVMNGRSSGSNLPQPDTPVTPGATSPQNGATLVPPPDSLGAFVVPRAGLMNPGVPVGETPPGLVAWSFNSGQNDAFAPVTIGDRLIVYGHDQGTIYGVRPDGELLWSYRFPGDALQAVQRGHGDEVVALGSNRAVFLNSKGRVSREVSWQGRARPAHYDVASDQLLVNYAQGGINVADKATYLRCLNTTDGSELWRWPQPTGTRVTSVTSGAGCTYALTMPVESGPHSTRVLYRIVRGTVSWQGEYGIGNGLAAPVEAGGTLYVCGYTDKHPALLELDARTGKVRRSVQLKRAASQPLQYDSRHNTVYILGSNHLQAVRNGKLIYVSGNDVDHAVQSVPLGGGAALLSDYSLWIVSASGQERQFPLGQELADKRKNGLVETGSGLVATIGGELVCFDFLNAEGLH